MTMPKITDELISKIADMFKIKDLKQIDVYKDGPDKMHIDLEVEHKIEMSFSVLKKLTELLGCTEIDISSRHVRGGCDTCDFGSHKEIELTFWGF